MKLLFYFREFCVELWTLDDNERLIPVQFQTSNKIPLYFLLNGDQIQMDEYARESFQKGIEGSYGDFWNNIGNLNKTYSRFGATHIFDTMLHFALKEKVLPTVLKSYFPNTTLENFIQHGQSFILFDPFIDVLQRNIITNGFFQIIGFSPDTFSELDFWDLFFSANNIQSNSFLSLDTASGNINIYFVERNKTNAIAKKVIEGKGRDPRIDTILDFIVDIAIAKGSPLKPIEIKRELANEGTKVFDLLPNGLVIYEIKNENIGVVPLRLNFHRSEIDGKLDNKQSLNLLQNELDSFIKLNNAENVPIYVFGDTLNQPIFINFLKEKYARLYPDLSNVTNTIIKKSLENVNTEVINDLLDGQTTNSINEIPENSTDGQEIQAANVEKDENKEIIEKGQGLTTGKSLETKEKKTESDKGSPVPVKKQEKERKVQSDPIPKLQKTQTNSKSLISSLIPAVLVIVLIIGLIFKFYPSSENNSDIAVSSTPVEASAADNAQQTLDPATIQDNNAGMDAASVAAEIANITDEVLYVACGYYTNAWESEGWLELAPNTSVTYNLPQNLKLNSLFLFSLNPNGEIRLTGEEKRLCIDPENEFHFTIQGNCDVSESFKEFPLTGENTIIEIGR